MHGLPFTQERAAALADREKPFEGLKLPFSNGAQYKRSLLVSYLDDELLVVRDAFGRPAVLMRVDSPAAPTPCDVWEPAGAAGAGRGRPLRRARDAPMFLDEAMQNPLTYGKALGWFYGLQRVVGVADEDLAGLHGLRVDGYNRTKAPLGQPLAQAHGRWA